MPGHVLCVVRTVSLCGGRWKGEKSSHCLQQQYYIPHPVTVVQAVVRRGREGAALYLPSYSDSGHTVSAHFLLSDTRHHVVKVFFCMNGHSI